MAIIILGPYFLLYMTSHTDPGYITNSNHKQHLRAEPFDHLLYQPGMLCRTCNFEKPARSKHCSLCQHCIAKQDHHCAFTNCCVGQGNIRFFLGFLVSNVMLLSYGWHLTSTIIHHELRLYQSNPVTYVADRAAKSKPILLSPKLKGWSLWWIFVLQSRLIGMLHLICILIDCVICGFLLHHLYLIFRGYTTNEILKWKDVKDALQYNEIVVLNTPWRNSRIIDVASMDQEQLEDVIRMSGGACKSLREVHNLYDRGWWVNFSSLVLDK